MDVPYTEELQPSPTGESVESNTEDNPGGEAHENRPPYFAVYYIMRVK